FELGIARGGIVGDFIRIKHVGPIMNLGLAPQFECRAVLFLLDGMNHHFILNLRGRSDRNARCKGTFGGWRLAGNYRRCEKPMTKRGDRDKDSRAGDHCGSTCAPPAVANGKFDVSMRPVLKQSCAVQWSPFCAWPGSGCWHSPMTGSMD